MGRYSGKTCRLSSMIVLTSSFFLVEIIVGYVTNSLALVGDAYHMLSDIIALFIGIASVRIAKWHSRKNTYGWARAEVLGALVNAVFLIALCFTILMEALQRLVSVDPIEEPDLLLIVGGIGLAINLIGLVLFGHHSHSHGGHSHLSDADHDTGACKKDDDSHSVDDGHCNNTSKSDSVQTNMDSPQHSDNDSTVVSDVNVEIEQVTRRKMKSSAQLNMRGVFLHVMGDALGSVIVIISALVVKYVEADWRYRIDPAMSIVLVAIILSTSVPLLKESALILLQTVPTHIQVQDLQKKLINKVEGVIAVHEFHIWQLAGNRIIASAHIHCRNLRDYMRIAEEVKQFFHNEGIHSTTIQPEFVEDDALEYKLCAIPCVSECHPMQCCTDKKRRKAPAIFRNCYHRHNQATDNSSYREIIICQDEDKPLMSLAHHPVSNGICPEAGHTTNGVTNPLPVIVTNLELPAEVGQTLAEPVVLEVSSLSAVGHQGSPPADPDGSLPFSSVAGGEAYRPTFSAPLRTLCRPQSLYDVPSSSPDVRPATRSMSSGALGAEPTDKDAEKLVLGEILEGSTSPAVHAKTEGATNGTLLTDCTTASDANLNQAIIRLKNDLKSIRGEAASKESILSE